jgi:superfamily II DNA or RNA helicase
MTVNCFNIKRGDGKTKRAIELCKTYVYDDKSVLLLVQNNSEIKRITDIFIQNGYIELDKIDMLSFTSQYLQRIYKKKYDLIVIDECFNMRLDAQARFLQEMSSANPHCAIVGFGTEVRQNTFRDYSIDTVDIW